MNKVELKKVIIANGEAVAYRESGKGRNILLLVHGNIVTSKYWEHFMENLPEDYKAYAIDLRGAGGSSYNTPVEYMRQFSEDIWMFAQKIGILSFNLVGLSMGGTICLQFAADHADMVEKLILIDSPTCKGYPFPAKDNEGHALLNKYWTIREQVMCDKVQLIPCAIALKNKDRIIIRAILDATVFSFKAPKENYYNELIDETMTVVNFPDVAWPAQIFNISHTNNGVKDGTDEVDKITMPTLVLIGDHDKILSIDSAYNIATDIGINAKVSVIKNAAHCSFIDNEEMVIDEINNFI
ncbi:intracellular short-chain-length polyhydroxyalkanoate depolymerase [Clostridium sp.]|uniref:intracellular short-chain-length polyhydroxyalkanoate depolymerase n=1 Tax=Clostridium sp. TaxID=1506 RepID=UPI003D6D30E0